MTELTLTKAQDALIARLAQAGGEGLAITGPTRKSAAALCGAGLVREADGLFYLTDAGRITAGLDDQNAEAGQAARPAMPRPGAKAATVVEMLGRPEGATVNQMSEATGWLPHSVRGFLAGALKKTYRLAVVSEAAEGGRIYRFAPR